MKVSNYNYSSINELETQLDLKSLNMSKTLIQVFSGFVTKDEIIQIQNIFKTKNKNATFIGTTTAGEIYDGKALTNSINISIVEFEHTTVSYGDFSNECDFTLGCSIASTMYKEKTKANILFLSGMMTNGEDVIDGMGSINNAVIIAGGMAGDNGKLIDTYVFNEKTIHNKGAVIATLNSDVLNVFNNYQLNWQAFGKVMKVTKVQSNRLYEVDNIPVAQLYRKYLGDKVADMLPLSATEFPLIKNDNDIQISRTAIHLFDDDSFLTIGNLHLGDEVQFSVGNVDMIVNKTKSAIEQAIPLKPEVMFNYSCAGRIAFLQSKIDIELEPFNDIAPTVGFFSYGEIMHKNNQNFLLNHTLTFLGLSESKEIFIINEKKNKNKKITNAFENKHLIVLDALTHLSNKVIEELNESEAEIKKSHQNIKDSINYAALIQKALLPQTNVLNSYIKENFIFWQPKDTVGGDIYFITELDSKEEILVMVIDGAGHGVSGAFVTMLVKAIETQIIAAIQADTLKASPALILQYFNRSIKTMLNQEKGSSANAGFDGGILYYNKTTNKCTYAGAKTDLYIIDNNTLQIIKGDRKHVGFARTNIEQEYTEHTVDIKKDTKLYIATDGYYDQEGVDGTRYGKFEFSKLLLRLSDKSLETQKDEIIQVFKRHKGAMAQRDDVTILGLKF